jgi:hypothetical protein
MPFWGQVVFGTGIAALGLLTLVTLTFGSTEGALVSLVLLVLYGFSAPFVIAGHWRAPKPQPTRRPVVRRRRS